MHTLYTALQQEFGEQKIQLVSNEANAIQSAGKGADALVVAIGEMPYSEGFGSIEDINLPEEQQLVVKAALATGKPVVLVMISGRPRVFTALYQKSNAVLFAGLPGFEGAQAIAEIISGKVNPSAKLSFNYPATVNKLVPHNHKSTESLLAHEIPNPIALSSFGEGLSYTTFEYSDLVLSDSVLTSADDEIEAKVTVTNTGKLEGKEAVLWFLFDEVASITRPVRDLKYYEKKSIKPGESGVYSFTIKPSVHLHFPDKQNNTLLEDGYFTLMTGNLKTRFKLQRK
jgi:beta-glucosidase